MNIFCRLLLCSLSFASLIHCLDKAGNSNANSHSANTVISCSSIKCGQYTAVLAGSVIGGGIGFILLVIGISIYYCRCRNQSSQTNLKFVNTTTQKTNKEQLYNISSFKSGIWSSRYLQSGIWHGPNYLSLLFDSQSLKVTGSGSDHCGIFTIDGTYSTRTARMALKKIYQFNRANQSENLNYRVIIQVVWNAETRQFEGTRYIQTTKYREENRFELKFSKE